MHDENLLVADNLSLLGLWTKISFVVKSGSVLLITGKNGAGKTSLIRILCGLSIPDGGRVLYQQQDIAEGHYHQHMLYVGHHDGLKDDLTAVENITFAATMHNTTQNTISPAHALTEFDAPHHQLCRDLSAGQRRRTALARLLAIHATMWLLDEPFTALDDNGKQILATAATNHIKRGGAIIMSSHQKPNWEVPMHTITL